MQAADRLPVDPAGSHIRHAIRAAQRVDTPYPYWLPRDVLPADLCRAVVALPLTGKPLGESQGKRETHNAHRIFVSAETRREFPACDALAEAFQDEATVALLQDRTGARLAGGYLRIECCLDTDGFWLEPHTDIGAKLFTMLVYLSEHPDAADWGTDIMDAQGHVLARAPGTFNDGLIFIPGSDTWHGFEKRPIRGIRRSLIVNYVKPEWRSRGELAFPETPVSAG
ncbi:MAG: hypothetical protein BGO51_27930 [Rhodospirillales bacterium 69-11]|nr:MAG: hypothetical protein BGO51_27930 [Rhodospirillales bacterium 69-11]